MSSAVRQTQLADYSEEGVLEDGERLRELYVDMDLTMVEIAERIGSYRQKVSAAIGRHGIEKSDHSRRAKIQFEGEPVPLTHNDYEYEGWRHFHGDGRSWVSVHRLAAVAWFGFDAVCDKVVHHSSGVRWDNREDNFELFTPEEHSQHHADEHIGTEPWHEKDRVADALDGNTLEEAAADLGCVTTTLERWIDRHGL